ncbi:MAG: molybdopterin-dependent oxidoreductase [Coriobacteriia bacterium]|nr:molybdopterin-dependent oxidoreductase [Coriobacteriia bacterium]MBS5478715.1 molybdopterin-dependent oxidoreductase [Coriobacteriia bacterium]
MGEFPGATGNSFQGIAKRAATRLQNGECKMDVLDPALGNGSVTPTMQGINWVPIKAATNAAFTCAAIQWIVENKAYNEEFVTTPNPDVSWSREYGSFSDATLLVIVDENHPNYRKFMRPEDAGMETPTVEEGKKAPDFRICIDSATGEPAINTTVEGSAELEFDGEVNGVHVRTAWSLMLENVYKKTPEEYSEICGVPVDEINRIAKEFTSHGTKASARLMGGSGNQNGMESVYAYRTLNWLVGSDGMIGGAGPSNQGFNTSSGRYDLSIQNAPKTSGMSIGRMGVVWTETDEYKNRVAAGETDPKPLLPYFPNPSASDNQTLWSIVNQYPYQAKIIMGWMKSNLSQCPGAMRDEVIEKLKDPAVVPLVISCDVMMGEDTQYADYIVPDTNPYESFGVLNMEGWVGYGDTFRWPIKTPESMQLDDGRYASWETFIIDVAKKLELPGFGEGALLDADGNAYDFNDACDFFLKSFANVAYDGDAPVEDITDEEIHLQALDTLPEAWKAAVKEEEWPKVLKVMSRGTRFMPIEDYRGNDKRSPLCVNIQEALYYSEAKATFKNPYTGETTPGGINFTPESFADGTPIADVYDAAEYPFGATTYKPRFRSISMQSNNPNLRDICKENYVEINIEDAKELGIADGDMVRVSEPTGTSIEAPAMVRAGVAKGNIAISGGYGRTAWGSKDMELDGETIPGNPDIAAGVILRTMTDPTVGEGAIYPLSDNHAGTPARTGGMYKIEKA